MEKHTRRKEQDSIFNFTFEYPVILIQNATREQKEKFLDSFYGQSNIAISREKDRNKIELSQESLKKQLGNNAVEIQDILFAVKIIENYEC